MEYTVQKLSKLAGISKRTLRYYDEIGLLKPCRINSSGYRIYSKKEIDKLQQILFYRELDVSLDRIKEILCSSSFKAEMALLEHKNKLLEKRKQLDTLIENVEKTIASKKGEIQMQDEEKFKGFKENMIKENEEKYGKEIREKYGDPVIDDSNKKILNMTKEQLEQSTNLANEILTTLKQAYETKDPTGELAKKVVELHKKWICFYWTEYSKEAHLGVAEMYVQDERFKAYYDKEQDGLAEFLRDAIKAYISK